MGSANRLALRNSLSLNVAAVRRDNVIHYVHIDFSRGLRAGGRTGGRLRRQER